MDTAVITVQEPGAPISFDSLPVLQLSVFPDAPGHELPFVQGRLCAERGRTLHALLTAYETGRPTDSLLQMTLGGLELQVSPAHHALLLNGHPLLHTACRVSPVSGEDLQGEFWGAEVELPLAVLRSALPEAALEPGEHIPFQLAKTRLSTGYTALLFEKEGALLTAGF